MWYTDVLECCFATVPKIPEVLFLRIFAAPMCIPCNANYQTPGKRKAGAKGKAEHREPAAIWVEQERLLSKGEAAANAWQPEDGTVKDKLNALTDIFYMLDNAGVIPDSEIGYAKKNSNYKDAAYLSFFSNAPEEKWIWCFCAVGAFYGSVLEKLFAHQPETAQQCLAVMKRKLAAAGGVMPGEEGLTLFGELGRYLCALLILGAAAGCPGAETERLLKGLFRLPGSESTGTRSVVPLRSVTLEGAQFLSMCKTVLDTQPELPMLEMIYKILRSIRRKADGQLDGATFQLVESYLGALDSFGRRTREKLNAKGWEGDPQVEAEIRRAAALITECKAWLPPKTDSQKTVSRT